MRSKTSLGQAILKANTGLDAIKRAPIVEHNTGIKCLRIGDLSNSRNYEGWGFTSVDSKNFENFKLLKDDIFVARTGNTIGVNMIVREDNLKAVFNNGMIRLRVDKENYFPLYIYYIISSNQMQNYIQSIAYGTSTQPNMKINDLLRYEFTEISLDNQKKIAHILSTLDDKIELNRKMNQTLEEMAQAIFKSWFVDFDPVHAKAKCSSEADCELAAKELGISKEVLDLFPSEFEESELGMIPKGWSIVNLSDHVKVIKGKSYKSSELQPSQTSLVTLKSFLRGGGYRTDGLKQYTGTYKPEQEVKPGEMVVAYTDVTQAADVIGKPAIVLDDDTVETFVASLDVGIIRTTSKSVSKMFLYHLFRTASFQGYILGYTSGTTVLHLGKSWLDNYETFLPNTELMEQFTNIVEPMFKSINENIQQMKTLEKTRDTLLPKLLSGELDVSELDMELE